MCWCVDKKKGEPIKGSMTNGVPNCAPTPRRGRMIPDTVSAFQPPMNNLSICEAGVTVHKCSKSTCENKICLGHPDALCLINPCGGCSPKWVSPEGGAEINCVAGLGLCHAEMQNVMNSQAWISQGFTAAAGNAESSDHLSDFLQADVMEALRDEDKEEEEEEEMMDLGPFGSLSQLLLRAGAGPRGSGNEAGFRTMRKMGPIFASLGNGVMGVMSGSVSYIGGSGPRGGDSSSEESSSSSHEGNGKGTVVLRRTLHSSGSSPVKSIADILADLMTSGSSGHHSNPAASGLFSDGLMDLMPSSSSVLPHFTHHAFLPSRVRRAVVKDGEEEVGDSLAVESSSSVAILPFPSTIKRGHQGSNNAREILVSILPSRSTNSDEDNDDRRNGRGRTTCPPPSPFALLSLLSGACGDECSVSQGTGNGGCPPGMACCLSGCGMRCIRLDSQSAPGSSSSISSSIIINPVCECSNRINNFEGMID